MGSAEGVIDLREELDMWINGLPEPPSGYARVFRGESLAHPTMKPAAVRGPRHVDDHLFRVYAQILAARLHDEAATAFDQLRSFLIWVRAIAQHYGPGTEFLDVTRSLEVAIFFARNAAERIPIGGIFGEPGPIDPARDTPATFEGIQFRPNRDVGYLHVFDVPVWDPQGPLQHGTLVDLSAAPDAFASSPRLQAQDACLLYCDAGVDGGDLKSLTKTVAVSSAITESKPAEQLASEFFPGPTEDQWYRRLLSVPLVHRLRTGGASLELCQAVPVDLYLCDDSWEDTSTRLVLLPPPILWTEVLAELESSTTWLPNGFNPSGATAILLELPIFAMTPELDSGEWNLRLIAADVPEQSHAVDAATGEGVTVDLTKVFVEFSPLEFARWEEVETTEAELVFARGAYVERDKNALRLWWISQSFPGCERTVAGPFRYFIDHSTRELRAGTPEQPESLTWPTKTLLVVLTLLRELSDTPIVCPVPIASYDGDIFLARVQGNTARLVRVATASGEQLFLLRHPSRDEPFSANTNDGGIMIARNTSGWTAIDPAIATEAIATGQTDHPQNEMNY